MSSTAAVAQALTTPFIPPQSCADQFITTSLISGSSTVTVLASGPADSRFAACQPSGWDAGESNFQFSPAVCPSGWTAYQLGTTVSYVGVPVTRKTFSTAYCCSSGFSRSFALSVEGISPTACFQTIGAEATTAASPSNGLRVHNAWHISWESSDMSTLSPTPPPIPCVQGVIISWVPGATVDPGAMSLCNSNDGVSRMSSSDTAQLWFLVVGMPIIFLVMIATCVGVWCRSRRRRKREETVEVRLT